MNHSDQNAIITALERAMISQIKEYRAEEHKWLLEYGNIQPEYEVANNIVAGGSFAMVYHELLPAFNDIDVFVIDQAFCRAFIKSDADRARKENRPPVVRTKNLYYDWYVDPDTFKVHSCYSGSADERFNKMVPVDFGAGDKLTYYKRGVRPKNVFDIDELYCQYAMLNKEFPDTVKYAERMASTLNALCARFATNVDSSTFETYSDMDKRKITPSRKYSYGGYGLWRWLLSLADDPGMTPLELAAKLNRELEKVQGKTDLLDAEGLEICLSGEITRTTEGEYITDPSSWRYFLRGYGRTIGK